MLCSRKREKNQNHHLHCPHSHKSQSCPSGLWLRSQKTFSGPEATRTLGRWLLGWGLFPSSLGEIPTRTLFLWSIIPCLSSLLLSKYLQNSACHPWVSRNKSGGLFSQLEPVVNAMNVQFLREHHKRQDRGTPQALSGLFGRDVLDSVLFQRIMQGHWAEHSGTGGSSTRENHSVPEEREGKTGWVQLRTGRMLQEHWT